MPTIDTLVTDIYALFDPSGRFSPTAADVEQFGQRLATHISNRISEERGKPSLRLSNLGTACSRKLWYSINHPEEGEPLPPEARIKFLFGDILEELLLFLAKQAGHTVEGCQDEVEIEGVKGHRDAIIDGRLVDCKSASSYSFKKFEANGLREDDPFGYLDQIGAYLEASVDDPRVKDKDVASFLVIDKQLGKICLDTYPRSPVQYKHKVIETQSTLRGDIPPKGYEDTPEGKSGNRKLCTQCSYCNYKFKCWDNLRVFTYAKGPVFLTEVAKEPKVSEA
jgi:hypothetical protein